MTQINNTLPTLRMNWPKTGRVVTGWAGGTLRRGDTVNATCVGISGSAVIGDGGFFEINMSGIFDRSDLVQRPIVLTATDSAGRTVSITTSEQRVYPNNGSPTPAA